MDISNEKDFLLAEAVLKLTSLERLLVKKGLFTVEELTEEIKQVSKELTEYLKNYNQELKTNSNKN